MTKANKRVLESYLRSDAYELIDVYKSCSERKRQAFLHCKARMRMNLGRELKIISHNSNFFSCAFLHEVLGITHLMVITPTKEYSFEIEE